MTPRFRVAGIPVRVHLLFLVTAFATGSSRLNHAAALAVWMGVVAVTVLLHELGHALAYRQLGCRPSIELHGLGGTTTGKGAENLSPRQDAWVSFAGPLTGFLLGGLVFAAQRYTPLGQVEGLARTVVSDFLWVNVGWALINLLPSLPLDGGHILASVVRESSPDEDSAQRRVHHISMGVAAAVLAAAIWVQSLWLGVMAIILGALNFLQLRELGEQRRYFKPLAEQARRNLPQRRAPPSPASVQKDATAAVDSLLGERKRPARRAPAPTVPEDTEPDVPHDPRLVGEMLLEGGLSSLAIGPLRKAYTARPSAETAHPLALALLDAKRYAELEALLDGQESAHVGEDTLRLIASRATEAGQAPLASRAKEWLARRGEPAAPREDEHH